MNKRKILVIFAAILLVLLAAFLALTLFSSWEWKEGLYFDRQDTLYSVKGRTVCFELAGYYVGDVDPAEVFEEGAVSAALISEDGEKQINVLGISTIKNPHYYDVALYMMCTLDEGNTHYNEIRIQSDVIDEFDAVINGDFRFQSFNFDTGDDVSAYMLASRAGGYLDCVFFVENNGNEDVKIIDFKDEFNIIVKEKIQTIPEQGVGGYIDFNSAQPAHFPMIVKPKETLALYYVIEVVDSNGFIFYQPAVEALIDEEECILCFDMRSDFPFLFQDAESVLSIIKSHKD